VAPDAIDPMIRVLHGSVQNWGAPDEIIVNEYFAREYHAHVGDRMHFKTFGVGQYEDVNAGKYLHPNGPSYTFRVAAIIRTPDDIGVDGIVSVEQSAYGSRNLMLVPTTFYDAHARDFLTFGSSYDVQLRDGRAGLSRFRAALQQRLGGDAPLDGTPRFVDQRPKLSS